MLPPAGLSVFTGIVAARGEVAEAAGGAGGRRIAVRHPDAGRLGTLAVGDSVAVDGACLTVREREPGLFRADLGAETCARTTLGALAPGRRVNLEPALAAGDPLGGHLVSGHVDGVGEVRAADADGAGVRLRVAAPAELARYLAPRGSVCVDGVSLTVTAVDGAEFGVLLVPHTLAATGAGEYAPGTPVNLEADLLARYLERLLEAREAAA